MTETPHSKLFDLGGKAALVTGGSGTIGTAVCRGLAAHGADVVVVDIEGQAAKKLAGEIAEEHGVKALGISCDVSDPGAVVEMVETACTHFDGVHILLNNAATKTGDLNEFFTPFEDFKLETWREIMSVNIDGMFLVAQAVGRKMIKQGTGGSIIQTASIYGLFGPDQRIYEGSEYLGRPINTPAAYAASKAAVIGLTKYLATYWADHGIRVNTLVPGGVENEQNDTFQKAYSERTPMGRMADRNEMVGAVVYLASEASSYVTGQKIIVDGGWTAW